MRIDLAATLTQAEFGALVGISQQAVSDLVQRGVLLPGEPAHAWVRTYCSRLREQATERASGGTLDLVQERAALARSQRAAQELRNAELRALYAPTAVLEDVLSCVSTAVLDRLDELDALLRIAALDAPAATRAALAQAIGSAGMDWKRATARLVPRADDDRGLE